MEDYLRNEIWKGNKEQSDDKPSTLIDGLAKIHNGEQVNKMEMEKKGTELKLIQPNKKYRHSIQ